MENVSVIVPVEDRRYRYQKCDVILIDFDPKVKKNRDFVSERSYSICAPSRDIHSRREMTPQDSAARTASSQSQSQVCPRRVRPRNEPRPLTSWNTLKNAQHKTFRRKTHQSTDLIGKHTSFFFFGWWYGSFCCVGENKISSNNTHSACTNTNRNTIAVSTQDTHNCYKSYCCQKHNQNQQYRRQVKHTIYCFCQTERYYYYKEKVKELKIPNHHPSPPLLYDEIQVHI